MFLKSNSWTLIPAGSLLSALFLPLMVLLQGTFTVLATAFLVAILVIFAT